MTTTLLAAYQATAKEMADLYQGTTTGAGSATTMVDSILTGYPNSWVTDNSYVILTAEPAGSAAIYDERKASSLNNSTGTLTTVTFAAAPGTGITYDLTRNFSPSEYRIALKHAAKDTFPWLHSQIKNDTFRTGNWLRNGSFENWAVATAPDHWTRSSVTCTKSSAIYNKGSYSCMLSTATGYIEQTWNENTDMFLLRGKHVKFVVRAYTDTTSALRLYIYDGITTTYSDYHPGWDDENEDWYVEADISPSATSVKFRIYLDNASANAYVEDARVISGNYDHVDISDLNLAQDFPIALSYARSTTTDEPWQAIHSFELKPTEQMVYINESVPADRPLRVEGIGYLDFLVSGASSTAWTATIAIDDPQLKILTASAIIYLYQQIAQPNNITGDRKAALEMVSLWEQRLKERKAHFAMPRPPARMDWGL